MPISIQFTQSYVGGSWKDSRSGKTYEVVDPSTSKCIARVSDCDAQDATQAVDAAHQALKSWQSKTSVERHGLLIKWFQLVQQSADMLAEIMTLESGKPLSESYAEVNYAASYIEWFAEEAKRVYGDVIPAVSPDKKMLVQRQGVGVCAAITPWNFPLAMITRKAAPALAAGCTMVLKPAEATPLSALALAYLAGKASIPAGVFNVVTASHGVDVGKVFSQDARIKKLSFTGSTAVGKLLLKQCADTVKRVSMELGGNAPFIVFNDADIEQAVAGAIASKYRNTGQTCVCANRFYVQSGIYDRFVKALSDAVKSMKVGHGLDEGVVQGPLINQASFNKVAGLVQDAKQKGAEVVVGGEPHSLGGLFYQPTILGNISSDMDIVHQEIFGPVAAISVFEDEADVIEKANNTPYGLAAYFYSKDIARVWRVSEALEYGMVGINEGVISTAMAPFGGVKESGMGREGSQYGMDEYLELKYLCMGGLN
ncbi:MAG: NAD-dependent succinate-semialdehyde dehydrogenase [Oleiphilaceae bacterium]|nr:NAD-dependent succinate-semialdehyde dehydrogenase [Oleiphilaceae bacterium]